MEELDGITDIDKAAFGQFLERLNDSVRQNAGPDKRTDEEMEIKLDQERQNVLQLLKSGKIDSKLAKEMIQNIEDTRDILDQDGIC